VSARSRRTSFARADWRIAQAETVTKRMCCGSKQGERLHGLRHHELAIAGIKTADVLGLILRVKSQREASAF
jgi:hypothetical protein